MIQDSRKKRYWLRGGITGIVLAIVFFILQIMLGLDCMKYSFHTIEPSFICGSFELLYSFEVFRLFVSPVGLIILGLIIGWLYGKIKSEHQ